MAKEMMIVFVYDTAKCCKEEDDPVEAVLYFHPVWVSVTQKLALAGQLMGVHHFLKTSFSTPCIIRLQDGKFVLRKLGQYVLAVGTDRNIHDWILERRADILGSLLKFFHCDLISTLEYVNNDRNRFTDKLCQMFEVYLPILQHSAYLFSSIPVMKLPKSASNIFLEAIQMLQQCQETNGVFGGALFYNNKVVATQLGADLTKQIVIIDPYRMKVPTERIPTEFQLPAGVQLLQVYIDSKQFMKLTHGTRNERYYALCLDNGMQRTIQRKTVSKSYNKDLPVSSMKRDTSRIFTVPEEGELDSVDYTVASQYISSVPLMIYSSPIKRKQEIKPVDRPKCSNNSLTPSVCSTPLKDVNRVLHGNAMLICNPVEDTEKENSNNNHSFKQNDIPDIVKKAVRYKCINKLKNEPSKERLVQKNIDRKSLSVPDITTIDQCSNRDSIYKQSLSKVPPKLNGTSFDFESSPHRKFVKNKQHFRTITDPHYPIFRSDGLPVSQSLYEQYIAGHYEELNNEVNDHRDELLRDLSNLTSLKSVADSGLSSVTRDASDSINYSYDKNQQETYKRSMSLPLKPLSMSNGDDRRKSTSECGNTYDFLQKRKLDGLQLTPLMSKLSLLADERTSGFCSRETTPSEFRDFSGVSGVSATTNHLIKQKLETVDKETSDDEDELDEDWITSSVKGEACVIKAELFLCAYQNMVLTLIMEDGTANNSDLIRALWQKSVGTLGKLESQLQQCLEPLPSNENKELYSILSVDPEWDTVQRSGLWGITELDVVSCLHDRFTQARNLTDIVVRKEDTVIYGNQCRKTEVFYQQAVTSNIFGGLPTPADLMGTVSLKAKRRLERDHDIVLL